MSEYKVHLFSPAVVLSPGVNPSPPHPKVEQCASLEAARALAEEESSSYEVIKIFAPENYDHPLEVYRKGIRYVDGYKALST